MKNLIVFTAIAALSFVHIGNAGTLTPSVFLADNAVQHGGGCRKDSPKGQCCHAGSKPYHCH